MAHKRGDGVFVPKTLKLDVRTNHEQTNAMTRGELLAHSISFALRKAQKVVRGLWKGLSEQERWDVACKTVEQLKEHGDRWKLDEELESPTVGAHSTPCSFTEGHDFKNDK
jgi:hypothetical protein